MAEEITINYIINDLENKYMKKFTIENILKINDFKILPIILNKFSERNSDEKFNELINNKTVWLLILKNPSSLPAVCDNIYFSQKSIYSEIISLINENIIDKTILKYLHKLVPEYIDFDINKLEEIMIYNHFTNIDKPTKYKKTVRFNL